MSNDLLARLREAATVQALLGDGRVIRGFSPEYVQRGLEWAVVAVEERINAAMVSYDYPEPGELRAAMLGAFLAGARDA